MASHVRSQRHAHHPITTAVLNVSWSYSNPVNPDLSEVLKEMSGKAVTDVKDPADPTKNLKLV